MHNESIVNEPSNRRASLGFGSTPDNKIGSGWKPESGSDIVEMAATAFGIDKSTSASIFLGELLETHFNPVDPHCEMVNEMSSFLVGTHPQSPGEALLALQMVSCSAHIRNLLKNMTELGTEDRCVPLLELGNRLMKSYTKELDDLVYLRKWGWHKRNQVEPTAMKREAKQGIFWKSL